MKRILWFKNGQYKEQIYDIRNGHKIYTTLDKRLDISQSIQGIDSRIELCVFNGRDLKLTYANGDTLVLVDYQKYKDMILYQYAMSKVDAETVMVTVKISKFKCNYEKVKRILAAAGAFVLMVGSIGPLTSVSAKDDLKTSDLDIPIKDAITTPIKQMNNFNSPLQDTVINLAKEKSATYLNPTNQITPNQVVYDNSLDTMATKDHLTSFVQTQTSLEVQSVITKKNPIKVVGLGSNLDDYTINRFQRFFNSQGGKYVFKYAEMFGIDPYLLSAVGMQESSLMHKDNCPGGVSYTGHAVGRFAIESPNLSNSGKNRVITSKDVNGNKVSLEINMENAINEELNTEMAAMLLKNALDYYDGNVYFALQGYNYGVGMVDLIIQKYADKIGSTYQDVINNYSDTNWKEEFVDFSYHPHDYITVADREKYQDRFGQTIRYIDNWKYTTYGDARYFEKVLSFYAGNELVKDEGTNVYAANVTTETPKIH